MTQSAYVLHLRITVLQRPKYLDTYKVKEVIFSLVDRFL